MPVGSIPPPPPAGIGESKRKSRINISERQIFINAGDEPGMVQISRTEKISMENPKPVSKSLSSTRGSVKKAPRTLAVDVGGTGIKAELLDGRGRPLTDRARIPTPSGATPRQVVDIVSKLAQPHC
jgi:hypothetical protein